MGVTIHYRGRVNPQLKVKEFYIYAGLICKEKQWKITDLIESDGKTSLMNQEEEIPYEGKLYTFAIEMHEHCEPLFFQITKDGYFKNWCKTQFAPLEIHMGVVDFFEQSRKKLSELVIQDEGGYWESRNAEALEECVTKCFLEMKKSMDEDPSYYGPVKSEDGRITDLVKDG
jgi:hypothetical protein